MGHSSVTIAFRMLLAGALGVVGVSAAVAQHGGAPQHGQHGQQGGSAGPCISARRSDWNKGSEHGNFRRQDRRFFQQQVPNVQSSWFTRPYPYHLDFYKMKYGGSYAPYFGNLYGPPQVVTAPPYYGPYYGNWGLGAGGYENGSPAGVNGFNGFGGPPIEQHGLPPEGTIIEGPRETIVPNGQPAAQRMVKCCRHQFNDSHHDDTTSTTLYVVRFVVSVRVVVLKTELLAWRQVMKSPIVLTALRTAFCSRPSLVSYPPTSRRPGNRHRAGMRRRRGPPDPDVRAGGVMDVSYNYHTQGPNAVGRPPSPWYGWGFPGAIVSLGLVRRFALLSVDLLARRLLRQLLPIWVSVRVLRGGERGQGPDFAPCVGAPVFSCGTSLFWHWSIKWWDLVFSASGSVNSVTFWSAFCCLYLSFIW